MSESVRPKYHQSTIGTYLKCGKLYDFRYVQKLKTLSRPNLTVGTSVDRSVTQHMVKKAANEIMSLDEAMAVASDTFDELAPDTLWDAEENQGEQKDVAVQLAQLHFREVAPNIIPATVQEEFVIVTDSGYDLGGTIDLVDANDIVRDTKTAARQALGFYTLPKTFQPAMYDFAFEAIRGRKARGFAFDILKKPTKKIPAEYEKREGIITEADHEWLFDSLDQVHKGITAGVELPAPEGSWFCSEKYCPYWANCKGK